MHPVAPQAPFVVKRVMEENQKNYIPPEFEKETFHCPACNVYAEQRWHTTHAYRHLSGSVGLKVLRVSRCVYCEEFSFWINERLVFPSQITAPRPHKDTPEAVLEYYNEARVVSVSSPRAAAALLRLAAKKLCESLGETDSNLNRAIGKLNQKGLPESVIQSLDTVRIFGNEGGAHEGQIDLTGEDNKQIVDRLFKLINFIVEKTITEPQEVKNMFASLPKNKKQGVAIRDKKK